MAARYREALVVPPTRIGIPPNLYRPDVDGGFFQFEVAPLEGDFGLVPRLSSFNGLGDATRDVLDPLDERRGG